MFLAGIRPLFARSMRLATPRFTAMSPQQQQQPGTRIALRMSSTQTGAVSNSTQPLSWNEFFLLRSRRRKIGLVSSIATSMIASGIAFGYFANLVIDFNKTVMGIEMPWIYGGGILLSGLVGWIIGPFIGNAVFGLTIGSRRVAFHQMDNLFLRHVAKNRPNPSHHNVNHNPLPDYYGEKIGSLHGYRHWLRECRLFEKKAEKFL